MRNKCFSNDRISLQVTNTEVISTLWDLPRLPPQAEKYHLHQPTFSSIHWVSAKEWPRSARVADVGPVGPVKSCDVTLPWQTQVQLNDQCIYMIFNLIILYGPHMMLSIFKGPLAEERFSASGRGVEAALGRFGNTLYLGFCTMCTGPDSRMEGG